MGKYAVLISAGPDRSGSALNGVEYALRLADGGHDVRLYLDGPATRWPGALETRVDHPLHDRLEHSLEREIVAGACAYCAAAFGGAEGCRAAGIDLLGAPGEEHGPNVAELVDDGYELLTMA